MHTSEEGIHAIRWAVWSICEGGGPDAKALKLKSGTGELDHTDQNKEDDVMAQGVTKNMKL